MDGRGEKEFRGATAVIRARISSREGGWNRIRSCRSVIRSVFEGGVGCESGGRLATSIDNEGREEGREERVLKVEAIVEEAMVVCWCVCWCVDVGEEGGDKG
jgi:hypothetical protein